MSLISKIGTVVRFLVKPAPVLMKGSRCLKVDVIPLKQIDRKYGDFLVHPCIRYIPEGLNGHKWWMVVTPYPRTDIRYENPVLYYGEENCAMPPREWHYCGIVQGPHRQGYNADGNLFFDGKRLWVFWKETDTENTTKESGGNCVMGRFYDGKSFGPVKKFLDNPDLSANRMTAPCVLEIEGQIKCLATRYEHRLEDHLLPHGKSGLSIWRLDGSLESGRFVFERDLNPDYPSDFDFWHADFFDYNGKYYSVVTPESAATILLGVSDDGEHYRYESVPLLSSAGNLYLGMYKASAVVSDGRFCLVFPRRTLRGRKSRIYCSEADFSEVVYPEVKRCR